MARSSHIYICFNHADELLGAWTVKHELIHYGHISLTGRDPEYRVARVVRVPDGLGASHVDYRAVDITEEILTSIS